MGGSSAPSRPPSPPSRSTVDEQHELPCDHLTAALRRAARAGGDTDTVAAIAGSLLGARWGATAVPLAWRRRLHGRRIYGEPTLVAADLDAMVRLAVGHGRPDRSGWPGVANIDYGSMPALCGELDGAWFGNFGGVRDAVDEGATLVVSLCRMGTADVPDDVEHHTVGLIDTTAADNPNAAFVLLDTARTIDEPRRSRRADVHSLRPGRTPGPVDGGCLPHLPRCRGRDGDHHRQSGPRRYAAGIPARRTRGDRADRPGRPSSLPVICLAGNGVVSNGYKV